MAFIKNVGVSSTLLFSPELKSSFTFETYTRPENLWLKLSVFIPKSFAYFSSYYHSAFFDVQIDNHVFPKIFLEVQLFHLKLQHWKHLDEFELEENSQIQIANDSKFGMGASAWTGFR